MRTDFELTPSDRTNQIGGPGFDAVVIEIWPFLTSGGSVHVVPEAVRFGCWRRSAPSLVRRLHTNRNRWGFHSAHPTRNLSGFGLVRLRTWDRCWLMGIPRRPSACCLPGRTRRRSIILSAWSRTFWELPSRSCCSNRTSRGCRV